MDLIHRHLTHVFCCFFSPFLLCFHGHKVLIRKGKQFMTSIGVSYSNGLDGNKGVSACGGVANNKEASDSRGVAGKKEVSDSKGVAGNKVSI